jgi:tetratricopeptide (TPR) repeat protein
MQRFYSCTGIVFVLNLTQLTDGGIMPRNLLAVILILVAFNIPSSAFADQSTSPAYAKAERMFSAGKYAEALNFYQQALENKGGETPAGEIQSRIGDCYFRLQDYDRARDAYRSALLLQKLPQRPSTQYWIGFCTFLLGNDQKAINEFLKIPELYPSSGMWVGTSYYWAGKAAERMGKKEQAKEYYLRAGGKGMSSHEQFALKKADEVRKGNKSSP